MARKKFFKRNKIGITLFLVLITYLTITLTKQQIKLNNLKEEEERLLTEAQKIQEEIDELERQIEECTSEEFIEKTAREKLKMVKPNEIIYIIQDRTKTND